MAQHGADVALHGAAPDAELPPLLRALLPRMLVRVSLTFTGKGRAIPPSAVYVAEHRAVSTWKADRRWQGAMLLSGSRARVAEAGALLGFITSGGQSRLYGKGVAVAFCAAQQFVDLLRSPANVGRSCIASRREETNAATSIIGATGTHSGSRDEHGEAAASRNDACGRVLVLVRNPTSRMFRPALACICA